MRWPAAVMGVALAACLAAQETPTIRVPVRLVSLPALVFSDENRLVSGCKPAISACSITGGHRG
jgi:hypothetical protein